MLRGKDTVAESGESLLCSGAELKEVKIRRRTLLNSGLSIGISSEGIGEEKEKKRQNNTNLCDVTSLLVELV